MCSKIFGGVVVLVSVILAVLVNTISIDSVDSVMMIMKFFEAMIPVLGVGALIKYVCCSKKKCCGGCSDCKPNGGKCA